VKRYQGIGSLPLGEHRRVVAIGTFDGVHLGHRAIIGHAVAIARHSGLGAMVMTFEPHPLAILRPEIAPAVLTPPTLKAELIEACGADELLAVDFTRAFARIRADRFVEMLASPPIGAQAVVVGEGFRFGHGGTGTVDLLTQLGRSRGLAVETPPTVASPDGKPISSTRIRRLVAQGRVDEAANLLAREHAVSGPVERGDRRGRRIGYPTANIAVPPEVAMPALGVYAARARTPRWIAPAAVNVGTSPTFASDGAPVRLEAHILDYDGPELYGETVRVEFVERLRDEERFESVDALVAQMDLDVARTREALSTSG